jgi:type VI secretion system protein ImpL
MNHYFGMLVSRWSISFFGTALLAGLVWILGPLLPGLQDWPIRLALVFVILLGWAVANLLIELLRRGRDAALASGVTAGTSEEAAAVQEKLTTALQLFKRTRRSPARRPRF